MNYHIANGRVVLSATPTRSIEGSEAWIAENLNTIKALLKQSGAVKITGLNWQAAEHFHRLYRQLIAQPIQYSEKATPRTRLHHNVFTSTDLPAIQNIALHNENSYTNRFPGKLLFGCLQPPESGGETTTCDMRQVYAQMTDELKQKFAKGWHRFENAGPRTVDKGIHDCGYDCALGQSSRVRGASVSRGATPPDRAEEAEHTLLLTMARRRQRGRSRPPGGGRVVGSGPLTPWQISWQVPTLRFPEVHHLIAALRRCRVGCLRRD